MVRGKWLYFEDLTPGRRMTSGACRISEPEIIAFARAFDPQPFHVDPVAARQSFFGQHVSSGWHTAALTMRLMVEALPVAGGLVGAGVKNIRWLRPVRPGQALRAQMEIVSARISTSRAGTGIVEIGVTTLNDKDETVQVMEVSLIVPLADNV